MHYGPVNDITVFTPCVSHVGHADCLAFALQHGCPIDAHDLSTAVRKGHLACVKLLVAHGHFREPYLHKDTDCLMKQDPAKRRIRRPLRREVMRCLEHILAKGCPIHTGTLVWAARQGDAECVRLLHRAGVPLWAHAWEETPQDDYPESKSVSCACTRCGLWPLAAEKILAIPCTPENAEYMWGPLRYGWEMGAPVTTLMEEVFKAKRSATRAVLACFHVASGLSQGKGTPERKAAWSVMGRIPLELIDEILVRADLEIPESVRRGLPGGRSVRVQALTTSWGWWQRIPLWEKVKVSSDGTPLADEEWVIV
jgi:hypothetical protein